MGAGQNVTPDSHSVDELEFISSQKRLSHSDRCWFKESVAALPEMSDL